MQVGVATLLNSDRAVVVGVEIVPIPIFTLRFCGTRIAVPKLVPKSKN